MPTTIYFIGTKIQNLIGQNWIYDYDIKYHKTSLYKTDKSGINVQ